MAAEDAAVLHWRLVDGLVARGSIRSARVEAAFRAVPRHHFLPDVALEQVYRDEAIPTKRLDGRVVSSSSQPAVMAVMLEQLGVELGHRVLEIGAGTGYNAALLARLVGEAGRVVAVDLDEDIVAGARAHLVAAGVAGVEVVREDGALGYLDGAPYDRIILTVAAWDVMPAWREQLRPGGRLVLPLALRVVQELVAFEPADGYLRSVSVCGGAFMPLRGAFAGPDAPVPLGPHPGLSIAVDDHGRVDAAATYRWLGAPHRDLPTGVRVTPRELWEGTLRSWLALHEPGVCVLAAEATAAERDLVPPLLGDASTFRATEGLLGEHGLALLAHPPGQAGPRAEAADGEAAFELVVRSCGAADDLARRLRDQLFAWDAGGRPARERLRVRAYPRDAGDLPRQAGAVITKQWTQLVCDWQ